MRKIYKQDLLVEDGAPPDDGARAAQGANKHRALNCPFCGAAVGAAVAVQITPSAKPDFAVRCAACDATGPWALTPKIATELWNCGFANARPASGRRTRGNLRRSPGERIKATKTENEN